MINKISLPDDGWAIIRDPAAVPVRLRRPIEKLMIQISQGTGVQALTNAGDITDPATAADVAQKLDIGILDDFNELNDLCIVARVLEWSFSEPVCIDSLLDLPSDVYEILQTVSADKLTEMMPNFGESKEADSPTSPLDV